MGYKYSLYTTKKPVKSSYNEDELKRLTTLQLREVCAKERIPIGAVYHLDRNYIIQLILKYRGVGTIKYIDLLCEDTSSKLAKFEKHLNFIQMENDYKISAGITIYLDADITMSDNCIIECKRIYEGNAILLNEKKQICGLFQIQKNSNNFFLTCKSEFLISGLKEAVYKNYSIGFLDGKTSDLLYQFYYSFENLRPIKLNCYTKKIAELIIKKSKKTNSALVIDFGTSSTSAGVYIDEKNKLKQNEASKASKASETSIRFIHFDTLNNTHSMSETIPTVISVKQCGEGEVFSYRFGYDATKNVAANIYLNKASIFYEMKKWINHYDEVEEIYDEDGNSNWVARKELIYQYLKYIIQTAERQYKCKFDKIHITSPVKQKQQFLELYQEILGSEYEVITENALDEGVAVLYNSISNRIDSLNFNNGEDYMALVIDCGGGTTDLTSCKYYIEDNHITYQLNLATVYANGDVNFGGNNLTYRIMQYLKIAFTYYYRDKQSISVGDIMQVDISDIYNYVDAEGIEKVYENLENLYAECEDFLPTKYSLKKDYESEEYFKIRSNFYFLWHVADKIKTDFYKNNGLTITDFHTHGLKTQYSGNKIIFEESWRLNINSKNNNILELKTNLPNVVITKRDVDLLLKADVYNIMKKFIEPLYYDEQLGEYSYIKLTGQTCKIDLFREALKEYIPGKIIETSGKDKIERYYKLTCVQGALKYENAVKIGKIAPVFSDEAAITPYQLTAYTYNKKEITLISSFEKITKNYGFVSRNIDTQYIDFTLKNHENKLIHIYRLYLNNFEATSYEDTRECYADKILQDDIDSIIDDEIKIFVFSYQDKWGFYTLPIERKNGELFIGDKKYFPFESNEWNVSFYDGLK